MSESKPLRTLDAASIVAGSMIGSGIFLAPALIADIAIKGALGAGSFVLIWIIGGLLTICGALSFAELAAALPCDGGQYVYLRQAYSPLWGFLYGWTLFTVIQCGFIAAVAIGFANYLGVFLPFFSPQNILFHIGYFSFSSTQLGAILLIAALTWLNERGLKGASATQNLLTACKLAALLLLLIVAFGSRHGDWHHFQPFAPPALNTGVMVAFAVAMSKALFAFDSWNIVTFLAGETREPARTLPRSLLLGTLTVTLVYALANFAYLYILPLQSAASVPGERIAAAVAETLMGSAGLFFIAAAIVISTAGCVNGLVLTGPWLYMTMARDGMFFRGTEKLDPKKRTPVNSLHYQAMWAVILVLSGSFGSRGAHLYSDLLTFTSFASLLFNALTVAAVFVLRRKEPDLLRPYRTIGYPLVPLLYLAMAIFFLVFIAIGDPRNAGFGALVIAAGVPFYVFWSRRPRRALTVAA